MTDADRNFLGIKERDTGKQGKGRKSQNNAMFQASTPKAKSLNPSQLTESQKKGLAKLGLSLDLISG